MRPEAVMSISDMDSSIALIKRPAEASRINVACAEPEPEMRMLCWPSTPDPVYARLLLRESVTPDPTTCGARPATV